MQRTLERKPHDDVRTNRRATGVAARTNAHAPQAVHDVIATAGRPLDVQVRARYEPALGSDFSRVRVHDDVRATRSADEVSALAYTVGDHVVLGRDAHQSGSVRRDRILAHELAHAAQQRGSGAAVPAALPIGDLDSPSESWALDAADAALAGRRAPVNAGPSSAVLQRQPKPDEKTPAEASTAPAKEDDEPTPWLTLQGQGLVQYQKVYTIPRPPPWLVGGQLAANVQFHSGATGFELALIGQYGRVLTYNSAATAPGDQGAFAVQPSWLFINTGHTQLAVFGQGAYASTSSRDPNVAGQQYSLTAGLQVTRDLFPVGPLKVQGVGSLGVGGVWAKGPADDRFTGSGTWSVAVGIQISFDAVKRTKAVPPPPREQTVVKLPYEEQPKADNGKKPDQAEKELPKATPEVNKPLDQDAPKSPLPADATLFFLQDKPLKGLPDDKNVLASGMGGTSVSALKSQAEATFAADPSARVALIGFASIEGPGADYNCELGRRRAEWLREQLAMAYARVADPKDDSQIKGNCMDDGGIVSFGSTQAATTTVEAERKKDRFAIVHFHRL